MACSCHSEALKILADLAASVRVILTQSTPAPAAQLLGDPPLPPTDPCDACKDAVCKDVPNGENRIVICDGKTLTTIAGTAEGQYLAWDNTAKKWRLTNV